MHILSAESSAQKSAERKEKSDVGADQREEVDANNHLNKS